MMSLAAELAAEARLVAGQDLEDDVETTEETPVANPSQFVLAGNATFTVVSRKTGTRFTYKVQAPKLNRDGEPVSKEAAEVRFVKVLVGSNNEADYSFVGTIFVDGRKFVPSKKSRIAADAPSVRAFDWSFRHAFPTESVEVHHSGACGRCGRKLTVPESIKTGLGPECAGKVGG